MIGDAFTAILAAYDTADHLAEPVARRVAWLSGQSSHRHSQLSPAQRDLLAEVAALGCTPLLAGFPYNRAALLAPWRYEPLIPASLRNAAQFLAARSHGRFRAELTRHLAPLFTRTAQRLVLLCGSSGLELLAAALPALGPPPELAILAIALGPVARRAPHHPGLRLFTLQGRGDWISRLGWPHPPDARVTGGHLDYAASPEVCRLVVPVAREFLA